MQATRGISVPTAITPRRLLLLFLIAKGIRTTRRLHPLIGMKSCNGAHREIHALIGMELLEHKLRTTGFKLTDKGRELLSHYTLVNGEEVWRVVRKIDDEIIQA